MMKISTKGRYGLTIMIELARKFGEGPTSLKVIAKDNDLSEHYLEQLAAPLRNAGLIRSIRGAYGGYVLAREPKDITSGDIIRVLEGPITPVEGMEDEEPAKQALWLRIRDAVKDVLDQTTLDELIHYEHSEPHESDMFYIERKEGVVMQRIYLDHAATTPLANEVLEAMLQTNQDIMGNPSSTHFYGRKARSILDQTRAKVANHIQAHEKEIIFTSGGTEADNLAIIGSARANSQKGRHIITTAGEHHAVLHTMEYLETEGFDITYLSPNNEGYITPDQVKEALREDTILVSMMYVNNETGMIQDIQAIAALLKEHQAYFHTDAVQAFGIKKIDVDE